VDVRWLIVLATVEVEPVALLDQQGGHHFSINSGDGVMIVSKTTMIILAFVNYAYSAVWETCLKGGYMPGQLQNRFRVRRREAAVSRLKVRQPGRLQVFARAQADRNVARHANAEHMLGVVRHAGCIAVGQTG